MPQSFLCYYPGETPFLVLVDMEPSAWMQHLSRSCHGELLSVGQDVGLQGLQLFKTDLSAEPQHDLQKRALQWLHERPESAQLPQKPLANLFPNGPWGTGEKIDVIVSNSEVMELAEGFGDPEDKYRRKVKKALNNGYKNVYPSPSPSEVVHSHKRVAETFGSKQDSIYLGRLGGVPATIFNPALATLQQRLNHLAQVHVTRAEVDRAAEYLKRAVLFYDDEDEHQKAIKDLLDGVIGQKGEWDVTLNWADNIRPDGSWWSDVDKFLILILELKNTPGIAGDAVLQAVVDYCKIISRDRLKSFWEFCNFPVVLVGASANRLEISAAVCVGRVYVTKLYTLDLSLGFHASENIVFLARIFRALSYCREDLIQYYDGVESVDKSKSPISCVFPSPTPIDTSKSLPNLTYQKCLARNGQPTSDLVDLGKATTAMFTATLDNSEQVIVKFTARYNESAHRLLADVDFAPKLHFCERVVGDLFMVVMDHVDGKSIWQLCYDKAKIPAMVSKSVKKAMQILHEKNLVFGDLRDNNILYDASENRVVLVDFDWAGTHNESRYPATLNLDNRWAEEVLAYGIMHKDHDMWQVDRLTRLCNSYV